MDIQQKIESLLFYKGEPVSFKELSSFLNVSEEIIRENLEGLRTKLQDRGIRIVTTENTAELRTAPEEKDFIEKIRKDELSRDLGRAGSETLSIILYKSPVTRSEIDFIRGVNSTAIIRNLLIRGLIEKITNPEDQRSYIYQPTVELLAHLGITKVEELPDYERMQAEVERFQKEAEQEDEPEE
jgi:segregation and condensation protein B